MKTLDIRIKVTADIIKDSDVFSEIVCDKSEKADKEFQFYSSSDHLPTESRNKSKIFIKAKSFQKKCLARITSLAYN